MSKTPDITLEHVRRTAHLARIGMGEDECAALTRDLNAILEWIGQLNEVETEGVEPFHEMAGAGKMRPDDMHQDASSEDILANAPQVQDGFFVVPKVIG